MAAAATGEARVAARELLSARELLPALRVGVEAGQLQQAGAAVLFYEEITTLIRTGAPRPLRRTHSAVV